MHFDDMIDPIFLDFKKNKEKFMNEHFPESRAEKAAFYWALKENIEQFSSKIIIHPVQEEAGGDAYVKYQEEKRGYEIGKSINENEKVCETFIKDGIMGKEVIKNVFLVKLKAVKLVEEY